MYFLADIDTYSAKYPFIKTFYLVELKEPLKVEKIVFNPLVEPKNLSGELFFPKGFEILENLKNSLFVVKPKKLLRAVEAEAKRWQVKLNISSEEFLNIFKEPFINTKVDLVEKEEKLLHIAKELLAILREIEDLTITETTDISSPLFTFPSVPPEEITKAVLTFVEKKQKPFIAPLSETLPNFSVNIKNNIPVNIAKNNNVNIPNKESVKEEKNIAVKEEEEDKKASEKEKKKGKELNLEKLKEELVDYIFREDKEEEVDLNWLHKRLIFYVFLRLLRERNKTFVASKQLRKRLNTEFAFLFEILPHYRDFPFIITQVFRFVVKYPEGKIKGYELNEFLARNLLKKFKEKEKVSSVYLIATTVLKKLLGETLEEGIVDEFNRLFMEGGLVNSLLKIFQGFTVSVKNDADNFFGRSEKIVFTFIEYQDYIFEKLGSLLLPTFDKQEKQKFKIYSTRVEKVLYDFAFDSNIKVSFQKNNILLDVIEFLEMKFNEKSLYEEELNLFKTYKNSLPKITLFPSMFF